MSTDISPGTDEPTISIAATGDEHESGRPRRDPVGWVMWCTATIIAITALLMSSIALGR
jgi:hypothetical protein